MTVAQLIKQLEKMPKTAQVGVSHGDNYEYEIAGWVNHVDIHHKTDIDGDSIKNKDDREAYAGHPAVWVTLHC
jgi:hypothetical protein